MKKHVFVFGAGVSYEYGYPLGKELYDWIKVLLLKMDIDSNSFQQQLRSRQPKPETLIIPTYDSLFSHMFSNDNVQAYDISDFHKDVIRNSTASSIDEFVNRYANTPKGKMYNIISKWLIGYKILSHDCGRRDFFSYVGDINKKVYYKLFEKIFPPSKKLENCEYSFITYNYDISLEIALYEYLKQRRNPPSHDEILGFIGSSTIHVYGQVVDACSYLNSGNNLGYLSLGTLKEAVKRIELIYEDRAESIRTKISETIQDAYAIIFMGFAYDEFNMRNIGLWDKEIEKPMLWHIEGTGFGLDKGELIHIKNKLSFHLNHPNPPPDPIKIKDLQSIPFIAESDLICGLKFS